MRADDIFDANELAPEIEVKKDGSTEERHPAFGMIGASRVSCSGHGATLHGSDFGHHHYVIVNIHNSSLRRDLSHDWIHNDGHEYVQVSLSEAQWATFVSSMNVGDGVPCTIERINGQRVPDILPTVNRREQFSGELQQTVVDAIDHLNKASSLVNASQAGVKSKELILGELKLAVQELRANVPFVAKSFDEHMDRTTERAKIEVNAYLQHAIVRAGLNSLGAGGQAPIELPGAPEKAD